jgi:hypothetical protein
VVSALLAPKDNPNSVGLYLRQKCAVFLARIIVYAKKHLKGVEKRRPLRVVDGANHRAEQLGATCPPRPPHDVEKETLKGGLRC